MVITRKIQIYISHPDAEVKKDMIHQVYVWRDNVRKIANITISHKFCMQNIRDFFYLKDEIKEKFFVKDLLKEGKGMSEQNVTYTVNANKIKEGVLDNVPSEIRSCLNQEVANTFKETLRDVLIGKASIRSYKNNIPMPVQGKNIIKSIKIDEDGRYTFTLFGMPWVMRFGRDRSNNQIIVDRCMSGEYKTCVSSVQIDDKSKKIFLLLCVELDKTLQEGKELESKTSGVNAKKEKKEKVLFARIGIAVPIVYMVDINAKNEFDSGRKLYEIGTSEYFHRRQVLQTKIWQCQKSLTDTNGGHGRKKKLVALEKFKKAEQNYVKTMMHKYSRELVNAALYYKCSKIVLLDQERREEEAKADKFVLRNWGYGGLKGLIEYKCKMEGLELVSE